VIIDLPGTDTSAVNAALVDIREAGGAVTLGRVLTLVIVTDEGAAEQAIGAANDASREHPCRIIVIARGTRRSTPRLDAQVRVGGDAGASEVVVLRLYGKLADHGEAVVVPLLLPDAPIVAWWPGVAPAHLASDSVGRLASRRITDSARSARPLQALAARRVDYTSGDTDFAWTRLTSWRALLAAALDQPPHERVGRAVVVGSPTSASSDLLAGWLANHLHCPVTRDRSPNAGVSEVRLERPSGTIVISRPQGKIATLLQPGQPDRRIALPRRTAAECLAEELRRLDPDEVYAETLIGGIERVRAGRTVRATGQARTGSNGRRRRDDEPPHELGPGVYPAPATSAAGITVSPTPAPTEAADASADTGPSETSAGKLSAVTSARAVTRRAHAVRDQSDEEAVEEAAAEPDATGGQSGTGPRRQSGGTRKSTSRKAAAPKPPGRRPAIGTRGRAKKAAATGSRRPTASRSGRDES